MTQEEKELLLKDISGRIPYQPMCEFTDTEDDFCKTTVKLGYSLRDFVSGKIIIKPYLRPMLSMTKDEVNQYYKIRTGEDRSKTLGELDAELFNFYHKNHIDYRGLIPMGLALEAPEEMYVIK